LPGGDCCVAIVTEAIRELAGQAVDMLAGEINSVPIGGAGSSDPCVSGAHQTPV